MISWKGKKVLGIGWGSLDKLKRALQDGAALVEPVNDPGESKDTIGGLLNWEGRKSCPGKISLRGGDAASLEDDSLWDVVVLGSAGSGLAARARKAAGEGLVLLEGGLHDAPVLDQAPALERPQPKALILHVHNVQRCGGTGNFVHDFAQAFREFQHVALCVNDPSGDPAWVQAVAPVMRTMYAPQVTKAILEEIDPKVVVLHSTAGKSVEGDWPYEFLQDGGRRFVIGWHHTGTYPLFKADLDVFVSEHVKRQYANLVPRMKSHLVVPPCTDLTSYAAISRNGAPKDMLVTTAGKACDELRTLSTGRLADWSWDHSPPGRLGAMPGYLQRFPFAVVWSGHQETWCRTVTEALASGCVTLAHRAGAIPEQIRHGENGYLFSSGEELAKLMDELQGSVTKDRLSQVAQAGRDWAVKNAGLDRLRNDLYPHLMRGVLGAAT